MADEKDMQEKLDRSRVERTTAGFYDKKHWEYAKERFHTEYTIDDKQVTIENEKKRNWLELMLRLDKGTLLDVGCAFGLFVAFMNENGWDAKGIDISDEAVSVGKEFCGDKISVCSADKIAFPDDSFDVVTAFDVLEHLYIEQIFRAVKEISRVAKNFIVIKLPTKGFYGERDIPDESYISPDKSHVSIYKADFWAKRFSEVGKFEFMCSMMWPEWGEANYGQIYECWMFFKRKK